MTEVERMEELRKSTGKSVLLECSTNPEEWLCTIGWHHRGQWFMDVQTKGETAIEAINEMLIKLDLVR